MTVVIATRYPFIQVLYGVEVTDLPWTKPRGYG